MPDLVEDPFERCDVTDLPRYSCAHCKQVDLPSPTDGVGINSTLVARFAGICTLCDHPIKKGSTIFRPTHTDNPFLPVVGYGCGNCLREIRGR